MIYLKRIIYTSSDTRQINPDYIEYNSKIWYVRKSGTDKFLGSRSRSGNPIRLVSQQDAIGFTSKEDAKRVALQYLATHNIDAFVSQYFDILNGTDML